MPDANEKGWNTHLDTTPHEKKQSQQSESSTDSGPPARDTNEGNAKVGSHGFPYLCEDPLHAGYGTHSHDADLVTPGPIHWWRYFPPAGPIPDMVNHPPHYGHHPSGVDCITIVEWFNFNLGNVIKYIWRHDDKGSPLEDLKKARWYLDREIERIEKAGG